MRGYLRAAMVFGFLIISAPQAIFGSNVAFDSAGDSAYNNGWVPGSNGGFGWGAAWTFQGSGSATVSPDPNEAGILNSPAAISGRAFELQNGEVASRLLYPPLQFGGSFPSGDSLALEVDGSAFYVGLTDQSTEDGFLLANLGGPNYMLVKMPLFSFEDSVDTGIAVVPGPVQVTVTRNDSAQAGNYLIGIAPLSGNAVAQIFTFYSTALGSPEALSFGASSGPAYFNNISITPEPSAICLVSLAGLCLLRRSRTAPTVP